MGPWIIGILVLFSMIPYFFQGVSMACVQTEAIREPAVAGRFYASDPDQLAGAMAAFQTDAKPAMGPPPVAIICPHAGYIFSGQIAMDAFHQAGSHAYDLIVILGTNHTTAGFHQVSVYPGKGYRTPLGIAMIDTDLANRLIQSSDQITCFEQVHQQEHSVEVQIPFVQTLFPKARILPMIIGEPNPELCQTIGQLLARHLKGRNALIVASSDLSHYPNDQHARMVDQNTLNAIVSMDPTAVTQAIAANASKHIPNLSTSACGLGPILTAMAAAKALGAVQAVQISYANSADLPFGNNQRVVGYGAVAFFRQHVIRSENQVPTPEKFHAPSHELSQKDKKYLLNLARKTIHQFLTTETVPLARSGWPQFQTRQGAFVTLKKRGALRGCIGHMAQDQPLERVVRDMALNAAFNDRRFSPVRLSELPDIEVEISVLTPYQRVSGVEDIQVGRDGVLLEKQGRQAVFLPQVAPEQGWNREQMLTHLSRKAGLPADAWKEGATFYTFQAIVFSESEVE